MTPEFELQILKCADGDLTDAQESALLIECEQHPERYRDLALALCESRRLGRALRANAAAEYRKIAAPSGAATSKWSAWSLATAACLLVAIGLAGGKYLPRETADLPPGPQPSPLNPTPAETQYVVVIPDASPAAAEATPPLPAEAQQVVFDSFQPWFKQSEVEALRRQGYELEEEPKLYILEDEQGNKLAIPQRDFRIRYVSQ